MKEDSPNRRYSWAVVGMLWCICFFNYADRQSIFSVFPILERELHFTKFQLGLIASSFMWLYAAGAPIAGFIGDRVKRKPLILGGCLFWSAVTVCTGRCASVVQFVTVRALAGMGETFYFPASMSLLSDYHGKETRSRALSFHQSSVYLGTILGSWGGAWFGEHIGWRFGFYFFGLAGALTALMLFKFLREPQRGQSDMPADVKVDEPPLPPLKALALVFANPIGWLLMLGFLAAGSVAAIFLTWTPTFLVEKFHFKLATAALAGVASIHLSSAVGAPLAGFIADRLTRRTPGGRVIVQAAGLIVGSVFVFLMGSTSNIAVLMLSMAGFGFCKGFYDSGIFAALYDVVPLRARGTAAGIMNTVGWGGGAIGPVAIGWLTMHGRGVSEMANMSTAIMHASIVYVLGAIILTAAAVMLGRTNRRRQTG